jgi:putative restriction endonuclease
MSVRDTIILDTKDLKYLLIDSLRLYSDDVVFIDGNNPYRFSINKKTFYVLIKNVHESGEGRSNPDECRIQISKSSNFDQALSSGTDIIVFGYFANEGVFTAWNPFPLKDRFNQKDTISVYSRFSTQKDARSNRIATYRDTEGQSVISFLPDYVGLYLENVNNIHLLDDKELIDLINISDDSNDEETDGKYSTEKEQYTITHTRYKRDQKFRELVNEAYGQKCAICGIQLELIEAAHIIPHSHDKGTDNVDNGICLCPLHHTAYDRGLIYIDEEYKILLNKSKIEYLEKLGLASGYRKFEELGFEELALPTNMAYYPNVENILLANSIRGIN